MGDYVLLNNIYFDCINVCSTRNNKKSGIFDLQEN